MFPTGGLPAAIHSGRWNLQLLDKASHLAAHRYLRALESGARVAFNTGVTAGRAARDMAAGQECH